MPVQTHVDHPAHPFWFIATQSGITGFAAVVYNVNQRSLRQAVTPSRLLGRVNAGNRVVVYGVSPVGTFVGGILGSALGLRTTFWIAAGGLALPALLVIFSPVVRLRSIDDVSASSPTCSAHTASPPPLSRTPAG